MNRWVSADPLTVHALGADLNVYAYVSGAPLKNVDPLGLQEEPYAAGTDPATGAAEGYTVDENLQTNQVVEFTRPDTITATGVKPPDRSEASPPIIGGGSSGSAADAQGATKAEMWGAAKGGAQNWFVDQAETIVYGPALKWIGGKALEFTSLRAPEPSARPTNLREWELRQQYDFMQGGLTFESSAVAGASAGGLVRAPALSDLRAGSYRSLRPASDAHHVIQDAAVRDLAGYSKSEAPAVELPGPSTRVGSPHYRATQVQRQRGGGTYAAERRIGYKALRKAGVSAEEARALILKADEYFRSLGILPDTPTRVPGNRR